METFETGFEKIDGLLIEELSKIEERQPIKAIAEQSIAVIRKYLLQIKQIIQEKGFASIQEEIQFFKRLKPRFYSRLIYFHKVLQIELNRPAAGRKAEIRYLVKEQARLLHFFKKFIFLYQYFRSDSDYMDTRFFLRGNNELLPGIESYGVDTDPSFTTGFDFIVAKMSANELLRKYLEEELAKLNNVEHPVVEQQIQNLSWTASKASLIELIYGLQCTGVFNNGKAALSEVALFMEKIFQIELGNYYRVFQEIRIRKKSRTQFLDDMKERLIQRMDFADENPKFS